MWPSRDSARLAGLAVVALIALGPRPSALGAQQPKAAAQPSQTLSARLSAGERASIAKLPKGAQRELVVGGCLTCHSATMLLVQHKDSAGWDRTVTQMMGWGATVPPERKGELVAYLAEHFPARGPGPTPASKP
jgi:hypothetical protein